jgi:acyl-CoA dehydrogenase
MSPAALDPDLREWASGLRGHLNTVATLEQVRDGLEKDVVALGRDTWKRLCADQGLGGLLMPESVGGEILDLPVLALVSEVLGGWPAPVPFLPIAIVGQLLAEAASVPDSFGAEAVIAGDRVVALGGVLDAAGRWNPDSTALIATESGPELRVSGVAHLMFWGAELDGLIAVVTIGDRRALAVVDITDAVPVDLVPTDPLRPVAEVTLDGARAELIEMPDVAATLARVRDRSAVLVAAEQLGVLRAAIEELVEYLKQRVQFGRIVGSYQGVKHRVADLFVVVEQLESLVRVAAGLADDEPGSLHLESAVLTVFAHRHVPMAATNALLLHGGIGFTWEHGSHLMLKRVLADQALLGTPHQWASQLDDLAFAPVDHKRKAILT